MIKRLTILLLLLSGWLVTYGQTGRSSGLTIYGGKDMVSVSTQFRASPFERALLSALNQVLLIN